MTAGNNPTRLHCETALAAPGGTSSLQASSGKVQRRRLNCGGDRQANNILWPIAVVRTGSQLHTRKYVARRTTVGLSMKEIEKLAGGTAIERRIIERLRGTFSRGKFTKI